MKRLIGVAVLMAMTGCSSMGELRQEQPYRSFSSTKGVEQAAECVLFARQSQSLTDAHYGVPLQLLPGGGCTVVSQGQIEFVGVVSIDKGSDIDIYFQFGIMDWRENSRTEAAKSCL